MAKEHKKLYKAGKNWVVATLTATTLTLLGGIGTYTAHADTTTENNQSTETANISQTNQNDNSGNSIVLSQPVTTQSNQTDQNNQSVQQSQINQGNRSTSTTPTTETAFAATNSSDGLDPNIYGTVNVRDWDYQINNNILNLTNYHGQDSFRTQDGYHIVIPNLNDFNDAGVNISGINSVGITSNVLKKIQRECGSDFQTRVATIAISKTQGAYSNRVVAENSNWESTFKLAQREMAYLEYVDLTNLDTSKIANMESMFDSQSGLKRVEGLNSWNVSNVTNMKFMFRGTFDLQTVGDLSNWDTSNVTNMAGMFLNSGSLQSVGDLSRWNTSNVTDMAQMFGGVGLQTVGNLGAWNTSNVTDMSGMFDGSALRSVGDLSSWDTSNVTSMRDMFNGACLQLVGDLNSWNTGRVTDMSYMFATQALQSIGDLSNWNTSNVVDMSNMFANSHLHTLDLSNWNTSNVTDMSSMFQNSYLHEVGNLSNWNTSRLSNLTDIFDGSGIDYFIVPNEKGKFNNQVKIIDNLAVMGPTGQTIATIKVPTFYKNVFGKSKAQGVYDIVLPLARNAADEQYKIFYDGLDTDTKNIFPSKVLLERIHPDHISNPSEVANSIFELKSPETLTGTINYVDSDGKVIKTDKISGIVGEVISIKLSLPDGYELANKDEQIPSTITVAEDGIKPITVNIKKVPGVQTGTINYVDQDGKVVKTDKISGKVGDKINIKVSLPDGYELANKDEQIPSFITVTEDGIKPITINVKKVSGVQTGSINYVDQYGKVIKTDTISGKVGDRINISLSLPNGYELANNEQIPRYITVTEDGIKPITINVKEINTNLANNEVPYDSTTVFNNVNANYGNLDGYRLTENGQGQAQLITSGWHATGASNSDRYRYMIVFDNTLGREIARQKLVPQVRSDVQRAYPNVDDSLYSGFNITIDIPNSSINHSLSLISRYSSDPNNGEGARVDHWFNSLAFNEGNQANLDGMSSNGNTLTVNGWHATNQAAGRPYHYIIAWDRSLGHEIARREVTAVSRPDVANIYNTVANAVNSGFSVNFNLTPQFFNDNIQFISRWTDDAAGNGNAVDYWFKPMNRTNRANLDSVALSNGQLQVAGWHATDLSQLEPNHYLIVFDNTTGQQVASEKVDLQSSQDVKNVFGDIQTADHSRFNYTFSSLHLIPGHNYSLVSRYSVDSNGNGNDGAHTDSWLNMGTFQQSAYSIDHVALNRRHMTVQGWVANDNAMTKPYAYAILLQNGREIGRQRLTLSERDDVAKVYPQIYRSQYSGFNANFDLPTFSTKGLQLVLRFTDDPAGNGNSSDNWINL